MLSVYLSVHIRISGKNLLSTDKRISTDQFLSTTLGRTALRVTRGCTVYVHKFVPLSTHSSAQGEARHWPSSFLQPHLLMPSPAWARPMPANLYIHTRRNYASLRQKYHPSSQATDLCTISTLFLHIFLSVHVLSHTGTSMSFS